MCYCVVKISCLFDTHSDYDEAAEGKHNTQYL